MYFLVKEPGDVLDAIQYLETLPADKSWDVEITEHKLNRTKQQSRLYWHWMGVLSDQTGYSKDDMHEFFKGKFLPVETKKIMGKEVTVSASTADLDVKQFTEYLEQICAWAGEFGFYLSKIEDFNQLRKAK